jgi:hypothetical protein
MAHHLLDHQHARADCDLLSGNHCRVPNDVHMTAAEAMFFTGAPLAHVVRYEDEHRNRRRGWIRSRCRLREGGDVI